MRRRTAWIGLALVVGLGGLAWGLQTFAKQRLAWQRRECPARDAADAAVHAPEFREQSKRVTPRTLSAMGAERGRVQQLVEQECELGHRLYDVLAAAHPRDSFVFSPHAIIASSLLLAAAGNDELIRQLVASGKHPSTLAAKYADLSYARALYDFDPQASEVEHRFPVSYELALTLEAKDTNRLAPEFIRLIQGTRLPVRVVSSARTAGSPALTLRSDFSIAQAWLARLLPERDGIFSNTANAANSARFARIQGIAWASDPELPTRVELDAGFGSQNLEVRLIALVDGQPPTDFCESADRCCDWQHVIAEVPETIITTGVTEAECDAALGALPQRTGNARYACAYEPDVHAGLAARATPTALAAHASLSFMKNGLSWSKPGPAVEELPARSGYVPIRLYDLNGAPRTMTFDRPFQFAVVNELGLIEAVGRVSNLASGNLPH